MSQNDRSNKRSGKRVFTSRIFVGFLILLGVILLIVAFATENVTIGANSIQPPSPASTLQSVTPSIPSPPQSSAAGFGIQFSDLLVIVSINTIFSGLISFIFQKLIEGEIQLSNNEKLEAFKDQIVQAQQKNLEDYRNEIERKQQLMRIAELISTVTLERDKLDPVKIQTAIFELSILLPTSIARDFNQTLNAYINNTPSEKDLKDVLIELRKYVLGDPDDDLKSNDILHLHKKTHSDESS